MKKLSTLVLSLGLVVLSGPASSGQPPQTKSFRFTGMYVEGCSCMSPCPCELAGLKEGCQGVGAFSLKTGMYGSTDISGCKIAYGSLPGSWVRVFVDAPNAKKRAAAAAFGRAALAMFGKIESVTDAKIDFAGSAGRYTVTIDGGKTMTLKTEPMTGGDGKTPMTITNIHDSLHPNVCMGKTLSCTYDDGTHNFTLSDSNAFFHTALNSKGKV